MKNRESGRKTKGLKRVSIVWVIFYLRLIFMFLIFYLILEKMNTIMSLWKSIYYTTNLNRMYYTQHF